MFGINQFLILVEDELKQLFLRKRALFTIILYAGTMFLVFWAVGKSKDLLVSMLYNLQIDETQKIALKQSVQMLKMPEDLIAKAPILNYPLPLLVYFFISLTSIPFIIPMISCDMISQDLSQGTQRFLLFRVSRFSYYWSKAFAHLILYILVQFLLLALLAGFCLVYMKDVLSFSFILDGLLLTLRLIPIIIVFLAFIQMISSNVASPIKSLILSNLGLLLMMILLMIQPELSIFYQPLWSGLMSFDSTLIFKSTSLFLLWSSFFWGLSYAFFWYKKL